MVVLDPKESGTSDLKVGRRISVTPGCCAKRVPGKTIGHDWQTHTSGKRIQVQYNLFYCYSGEERRGEWRRRRRRRRDLQHNGGGGGSSSSSSGCGGSSSRLVRGSVVSLQAIIPYYCTPPTNSTYTLTVQ